MVRDAVASLGSLYGHGDASPHHELSSGQAACLRATREAVQLLGPPPSDVLPARAFTELCGERPGYGTAGPRASYQKGLVSLPSPASLAVGRELLRGEPLQNWCDWKSRLLKDSWGSCRPERPPYSDPRLVKNHAAYGDFIASLLIRGLIYIGADTQATVGIFFVWKKTVPYE